jgi:hypothetical protein
MINFTINEDEIVVEGNRIKFNGAIGKAEEYHGLIIVLLEFKNNDNPLNYINELYALSANGQIIWKMEDVRKVLGQYEPDPLVNFMIVDDQLIAFDFCSRKYTINLQNGRILDLQIGRW